MGVDLKLLIVDGGQEHGNHWFSHTMIEIGRNYALHDKLNKKARTLPGTTLSAYVATIPDGTKKGESCYGDVIETPYGSPLTYVTASEFIECSKGIPKKERGLFHEASLAFLKCLKPTNYIALYYH